MNKEILFNTILQSMPPKPECLIKEKLTLNNLMEIIEKEINYKKKGLEKYNNPQGKHFTLKQHTYWQKTCLKEIEDLQLYKNFWKEIFDMYMPNDITIIEDSCEG